MDIKEIEKKYHIILIISILILIIYFAMFLSTPDFSQKTIQLDDFSVDIPSDANYNIIDGRIEIIGPYAQYLSEIIMTNSSLELFYEAIERGNPSVESYNDTYYLIRTEPDYLDSEIDGKYYQFYDFIVPKADFNSSNNKLLNEKSNVIIVKCNYQEMADFLEENLKTK